MENNRIDFALFCVSHGSQYHADICSIWRKKQNITFDFSQEIKTFLKILLGKLAAA